MMEVVSSGLGATVSDASGLALVNPTLSTSMAQTQISPPAVWQGSGWNSGGTVSELVDFLAYLAPVMVAGTHPTGSLVFESLVLPATQYGNPIVFTTAGSVGIGITAPQSRLDVAGGVAVGSYAGTNPAPASGAIVSGSVGIGTTNPLNQLDVAGGVALGSYAGSNTAPAGGLIVPGSVGLGTTNPNTSLDLRGGLALGHTTPVAGYSMTVTDCLIFANANTAALTVTLPSATAVPGRFVHVKKIDTSAHAVTVAANTGDNIENAASVSLNAQFPSITLLAATTVRWFKLAST